MYLSENVENLLKKIIEKDINQDPFEQFNLTLQGYTNANKSGNEQLYDVEQLSDLKQVYRAMIASVDSCIDLITKFTTIEPQSPSFASALGVVSLDQFERYILLSELPDSHSIGDSSDTNDTVDDNTSAKISSIERRMNLPVKLGVNPSYMASVLGYRMRVIDSMVRAVKALSSNETN